MGHIFIVFFDIKKWGIIQSFFLILNLHTPLCKTGLQNCIYSSDLKNKTQKDMFITLHHADTLAL